MWQAGLCLGSDFVVTTRWGATFRDYFVRNFLVTQNHWMGGTCRHQSNGWHLSLSTFLGPESYGPLINADKRWSPGRCASGTMSDHERG